ncbi:MAG: lysophospholipid acyltransferase family protein [Gammaproteobacteria bacterium]|nr:lysophospholipid acyltransferase family protein [Gammaproteobacteria bacterium]
MTQAKSLWHPVHWPAWFGVGVLTLFSRIPYRLRNRLVASVARLTFKPSAKQTRVARLNLELCFPEHSSSDIDALLRLNYCRYLQILIQLPTLWWGNSSRLTSRVKFRGEEHLPADTESGSGAVLLFTHTIGLEFGATAMSALYPMQGIYNPFNNAVVDHMFERGRKRFGGHVAARGEGLRTTLKRLSSGIHLVYLADEDFGHEGSVFAPFFSQPKATLAMLPRIARHAGAPVLPAYTVYDPETDVFVATIDPPIQDYPDEDPVVSATLMNAAIESTIRACPEQYLWKLRLFRSMPDGGPSRYTEIRRG